MKRNIVESISSEIDSQIEAIRSGFTDKEDRLRSEITSRYEEIQSTTEEEFLKKQLAVLIDDCESQIELFHKLANPTSETTEKMDRIDKKDFISSRISYLEYIDRLAIDLIELRKNGLPDAVKCEYSEVYKRFRAMSSEDLREYILRCIEQQLEADNREIARLEAIKNRGR